MQIFANITEEERNKT